jgi:D-alanyl-D-alanine carboxypeptidase-like protein
MSAQTTLEARYGLPSAAYENKYCTDWPVQQDFPWFPATHFMVNIDFKKMLFAAFTALQAAGRHTEIKTFDGCANDRPVRDSEELSLHAWDCAIDLNAADNPMIPHAENLTPAQRLGGWSQEFVNIMTDAGLFFGGDFIHRADSMHFAMLDG